MRATTGGRAETHRGAVLLVDPLLPDDETEPVFAALEERLAKRVAILITIGYHVRSAVALWARWQRRLPVTIHGPRQVERRLPADARVAFDEQLPAGIRSFPIGRPRRGERPLWLPSHAAVAFGDALVANPAGELRIWIQEPLTDDRAAFYRDRFAPTLRPLLELPVERVLVTHGPPVLDGASKALADAVEAPPWFHRG